MKDKQKFWFVWNPLGRAPQVKHESLASARCESERLANLNPNQRFIVLESVGEARVERPSVWTNHEYPEPPF